MANTFLDITPTQHEIDSAYAVKVFLHYHPERTLSIPALAKQSGIPEERLKAAFLYQFQERLETYWEKAQQVPV